MTAFDRRADVAAVTAPALILCGDADRMTPVKYSQFLATKMPGARLIIMPGAGHMAILEPISRLLIADAVQRFLETLSSSRADAGRNKS